MASLWDGWPAMRTSRNAQQTGNGRLNLVRALIDYVQGPCNPAGAAPVGAGGPFVGPYTAGAPNFRLFVAPTSSAQAATRSFTVLVENRNANSGNDGLGCFRITMPLGYVITAASVTDFSVTAGKAWDTAGPTGTSTDP